MSDRLAWEGFGPDDPESGRAQGVPEPRETAVPARPASSKFETVPNGFGGTTTRRRREPAADAPTTAPTERQVAFLRELLAEREGNAAAEDVRSALNRAREEHRLDRRAVSNAIKHLQAIERNSPPRPKSTTTDVPAGRYAVDTGSGLRFYRVDRPEQGKWAGYTFVKVQASDDEWPVKGEAATAVLQAIALDVEGAGLRYGQEIGRCCRCGRTLTNEDSRAAGIGPECAEKGW